MKFLITMTDADGAWDSLSSAEQDRIMKQHEEFRAALEAEGRFVSQCHLFPRGEARTVRRDGTGRFTIEPGPFTGGSECVGGFYVIEAESLDDAVEWARRGRFMVGANEVRRIHEG